MAIVALAVNLHAQTARTCHEPYRVSREEMLQAMSVHGAYNLTATTTSMRFGAEALLVIARRRQQVAPGGGRFLIDQDDWFSAHRETAGVTYADMSAAARAGFEHHQDALVEYGPHVVAQVLQGPTPVMSLDVTIFWPDSAGAPSSFSYKDTLSTPKLDMQDERVIQFKLLEYDSVLVFDQVSGISIKPLGFLSAVFAVLGRPDLKQSRLAVSADQWQIVRGQVHVFPGISKTGTAVIEPDGRGHEGIPPDRPDLGALERRIRQPIKLRYGGLSC